MSNRYLAHIADKVINRPLMITPDKLAMIASVIEGRIALDVADLKPEPVDASRFVGSFDRDENGQRKAYRTQDGVAIIPVQGSLVNRYSWLDAVSGMTSYEQLKSTLGKAAADPDVSAVLLDIDSPGGEAIGCFEVADAVRAVAAQKPVTAVANGLCCSAAYAIASAATTLVSAPSSVVGSIGVVMLHVDQSAAMHSAGLRPTLIYAGARKVDGNSFQPLTDDVRGELKSEIDKFYALFVETVAKGRSKMSDADIRATEARTYLGAEAVLIGLADSVGTFESALADLATGRGHTSGSASPGSRLLPSRTGSGTGLVAAAHALAGGVDVSATMRPNAADDSRLPAHLQAAPELPSSNLMAHVVALVRREHPNAELAKAPPMSGPSGSESFVLGASARRS